MKVLLVSQYFAPEVGATQNRMMEFTRALVRAGHHVDVLAEVPNHPSGVIASAFRAGWVHVDRQPDYTVTRVWVATAVTKTFWTRLAFYFSFLFMSLVASVRLQSRYDVVIATSPPLPSAVAALAIARFKRARFVLDVRDLWPRAAIALGELRPGVLYALAERAESMLYRGATLISATTTEFCRYIAERGTPRERIRHVPNGTRPDVFRPDRERGERFRDAEGLSTQFIALYAGLHGIAQGLSFVLDAAERLADVPDVTFVFMGEGPMKARLLEEASRRALGNVRFLSERPIEECAAALSAANVSLVPLAPNEVFDMFVPSKMFDAMAAGCPVVLSVDGEARRILDAANAGVFVPSGDGRALADALLRLRADPDARRRMGECGRQFVLDRYDRAAEADRFVSAMEAAVSRER